MTDAWQCTVCGRTFVIPSLARECEAQHAEGEYHPPMKLTGAAAGVAVVALLAGCGSGSKPHTINTGAMMHDMGYTNPSTSAAAKYVATIRKGECTSNQKTDEFEIAQALDNNDTATIDNTRIAMKYICPDKVSTWDKARAEVAAQ